MSNKMLLVSVAFVGVGTFIEERFLPDLVPFLYEPSPVLHAVPRAFGLIPLVLTAFSFWYLTFGFKVGQARGQCKEAAEKAGEKELERYSPPFLYVPGTSEHAIKLNQVQRAHQHVLESITSMYVATIFCALVYPVTTFVSTSLWAYGRVVWSGAYAEKGASGRYSNSMSLWIWKGQVINYIMAFMVGFSLIFGSLW